MDIEFVVGKNGSGKSRYLQEMARETDRQTILICNTVHDRYRASSKVRKFSIRNPKSNPSNVIKSAFIQLVREAGYRLNTIAKVLEYCNYEPCIGFGIVLAKNIDTEVSELQHLAARGKIDFGIDINFISSLLERVGRGDDFLEINLADSYTSSLGQETLLGILENEHILRKMKLLKSIDIHVRQKGRRGFVKIEQASSGELTLIASQIFALVNIKEGSLILIDEPENSLHPQWQKDYVNSLGDLIARYSPTVIIATHSPLIVSGVRNSEDVVQFHYAETGETTRPGRTVPSAEESLWEQFETITPESRYVSDHIVDLLENLEKKSKSFDEVIESLNEMEEASYDYRQEKVLRAAKALAIKIRLER
jgi:predicted ATPase